MTSWVPQGPHLNSQTATILGERHNGRVALGEVHRGRNDREPQPALYQRQQTMGACAFDQYPRCNAGDRAGTVEQLAGHEVFAQQKQLLIGEFRDLYAFAFSETMILW